MTAQGQTPSDAARAARATLKGASNTTPKRGQFFVLDRDTFHVSCSLGMRPAVALLVLARFTNRYGKTGASAHAIEQRTGIGRKAAREAIASLEARGIVLRSGSQTRPRYALQHVELRPPLSDYGKAVIARALRGEKLSRSESGTMKHLESQGYAHRRHGRWEPEEREREPVWLPNTLVDGVGGRDSPVELLRQSGDVMALRLLVDLYTAQRLDEWGGIDPQTLRQIYPVIGRFDVHTVSVIEAERGDLQCHWNSVTEPHRSTSDPGATPPLWQRVHMLERLGLLEFVPHVLDGDGGTVYPCPLTGGEEVERAVGIAVQRAAIRISVPGPCPGAELAIVPRHMTGARIEGRARLTFRPKTRATAVWLAETAETCARWGKVFESVATDGVTAAHVAGLVG